MRRVNKNTATIQDVLSCVLALQQGMQSATARRACALYMQKPTVLSYTLPQTLQGSQKSTPWPIKIQHTLSTTQHKHPPFCSHASRPHNLNCCHSCRHIPLSTPETAAALTCIRQAYIPIPAPTGAQSGHPGASTDCADSLQAAVRQQVCANRQAPVSHTHMLWM